MKIIASILVAAALLATPATAGWAGHDSFKGVSCEDEDVMAAMYAGAKDMRFDNGRRALAGANGLKIRSAKTIEASADKLVCQLRISFVHRGTTQKQTGRLTIRLFPGDRWTASFNPGS
jgi:hypothetical protein